jgi:hypothetical protein
MNALMPKFEIDKLPVKRVDMSRMVDVLRHADEIDGLEPIDVNAPEHVQHYFANGAYVREMIMPANTLVVGRIHKHETINVLLEGELTVIDEHGNKTDLKAPHVFVAPAGNQKAAYTKTPIKWLNCFSCETTDPDEALELLTCETMQEYNKYIDEQDVKKLASDLGHTLASMRKLVETDDVIYHNDYDVYIDESDINGTGLFADNIFRHGDLIAPMRIGNNRSIAGRYTNHSLTPNSKPEYVNNVLSLVCVKPISCSEEITVNYREVLKLRSERGEEL